MNENIRKHFEMKLLYEEKRIIDENGKKKEVYVQPERSKREDSAFICAKCECDFVPSDWQNDICDKCFYKR